MSRWMIDRTVDRQGFSLIELIVVVAIIAILAGIGVPYYLDSISDARRSVLRQNMANYRKVLNDFKGDQGRGPFRVPVVNGATVLLSDPKSNDPSLGSELVGGPIQYDQTQSTIVPWRRKNLQYLSKLPVLEDPDTGQPLTWGYGTSSAYFYDDGTPGQFDIMDEFWFIDEDRNGKFTSAKDRVMSHKRADFGATDRPLSFFEDGTFPGTWTPLDYIDVTVTDLSGVPY